MKSTVLSILLMSACTVIYAQADSSPYQAIVAVDSSGDYKTAQEAINAVSDEQIKPWLILVKNGLYNEQVVTLRNKPHIHLISQDKDKTIIHLNLNVSGKLTGRETGGKTAYWEHSVYNPPSPVYKYEGSIMVIKGDHFYMENISHVNDWGALSDNDPQVLAMNSRADCVPSYNCRFRSFRDTWMTADSDVSRHYAKDCRIEDTVGYFCGGGDVLLENCTLYNIRSGAITVAPSYRDAKYGYAFRNCTIDGNSGAAGGRLKLGRPWHNNSKVVYVNTIMLISAADEGWTNMGTVLRIFVEYDNRDAQGNVLDLSKCKTKYQYKDRQTGKEASGTYQVTMTKEEADKYMYENMIPGNDGWNPRIMMEKLGSPCNLVYQQGALKRSLVKNVIGYITYDREQILGMAINTSFPVSEMNYALKVSAMDQYGTQGKKGIL